MSRVLVGVSGGVDSAVTTYLLKQKGYEVVGLYLKMFNSNIHDENIKKIDAISKKIGFEYFVEDISEEFSRDVYNYFVDSYKNGETPNPCAMCNKKIKFGEFIRFLDKFNCQYLATGHYVKSDDEFIYKAKDNQKDQSYFMFGIDKNVLQKSIFPLADYDKSEIKMLAEKIGLTDFASQKESQDICFIENSYIDVLEKHFNPSVKGRVINSLGEVVGEHKGFSHYTIGQRRGFSLFKSHIPHYVIGINSEKNEIIVGNGEELQKNVVYLRDCNLFVDKSKFEADVKIRYRSQPVKGVVEIDNGIGKIEFYEAVSGVANGQAAVFYDNDKLLGGGWIIGSDFKK